MRIIMCGGRDYTDDATVDAVVRSMAGPGTVVLHGDARGADTLVDKACHDYGLQVAAWPADWERHGKAAGPIRNQQMLDAGADLVVAFPGGRGTADMVSRAVEAGVPVLKVYETEEHDG